MAVMSVFRYCLLLALVFQTSGAKSRTKNVGKRLNVLESKVKSLEAEAFREDIDLLNDRLTNVSDLASTKCDHLGLHVTEGSGNIDPVSSISKHLNDAGTKRLLLGFNREKAWMRSEISAVKDGLTKAKHEMSSVLDMTRALKEEFDRNMHLFKEMQESVEKSVKEFQNRMEGRDNDKIMGLTNIVSNMKKELQQQAKLIETLTESQRLQVNKIDLPEDVKALQLEKLIPINDSIAIINGRRYYIESSEKVTWFEAYDTCKSFHGYLAKLENRNELRLLSLRFAHWVGGIRMKESWRWDYEGEEIPRSLLPYINYVGDNARSCLYAIWYMQDASGTIGTQCDDKINFVCEFDF